MLLVCCYNSNLRASLMRRRFTRQIRTHDDVAEHIQTVFFLVNDGQGVDWLKERADDYLGEEWNGEVGGRLC